MNQEANRVHEEFLEVVRRHIRGVMNRHPKSVKAHCADIGICWTTFNNFMNRGKNIIHPETFSKIMKWLENLKEMLSEDICRKYYDEMRAAVDKEKKDI